MIPRADIIEWRTAGHPWQADAMVEQDLIISRVRAQIVDFIRSADKWTAIEKS